MARFPYDETYMRHLVNDCNMTYQEVYEHLKQCNSVGKSYGLSVMSVRRFCKSKGIGRFGVPANNVDGTEMSSGTKYKYDEDKIRYMIEELKMTKKDVYENLRTTEGQGKVCGLSIRSLERFCEEKGISNRSCLADQQLDDVVSSAVEAVGPSYGHRMLRGYLLASGSTKSVSKHRVRASLARVDPLNAAARRVNAHKKLNPRRYHAPYFGYNLHVDQNEKLVDYGIVFAAAIDGYSSYIFPVVVMPRKNNITIYRDLFKSILENFGLFYKVHADGGSEFLLTLFMQQYMWRLVDPERDPLSTYRQTKSTMNNRIERYWEENNQRVTYYMKDALILLERSGHIDAGIPHHLFSISQVGMYVVGFGSKIAADAWNHHHIENRGKPIEVAMSNNGAIPINGEYIMEVADAKELYRLNSEAQRGPGTGQLTEEYAVGADLLEGNVESSVQRDRIFYEQILPQCGGLEYVYGRMVNCEYGPFQNLVLNHIQIGGEVEIFLQRGEETEWAESGKFSEDIRGTWDVKLNPEGSVGDQATMPIQNNNNNGGIIPQPAIRVNDFAPNQARNHPISAARPPVAIGTTPVQQGRLNWGRNQQQLVLFQPAAVSTVAADQVSSGGGIGQRNGRRRTIDSGGATDQVPAVLTIHFHLAKRISKMGIAADSMNGISVIPVTFSSDELKSVKKMNEKLANTISGHSDVIDSAAEKTFVIYGPSKSRLIDFDEMKNEGIQYWIKERKKTSKYWAVQMCHVESADSDSDEEEDEDEGSQRKKRKAESSGESKKLKKILKRQVQSMKEMIQTLTSGSDTEKADEAAQKSAQLNGFLESLSHSFSCSYCCGISSPPVQCGRCGRIVACKGCADTEMETENVARLKSAGSWKCPQCGFIFFDSDPMAYREVTQFDISYLQKWEAEKMEQEDNSQD